AMGRGTFVSRPAVRSADQVLARLRRVVLLAGGVRATLLQSGIGRCILDLPLTQRQTLLNHWQEQVSDLAARLARRSMDILVMIDWTGNEPRSAMMDSPATVTVERDPLELRGTGGVLRDLATHYEDDDYLLVVSARQMMTESLSQLTLDLAATGGDVSIVAHDDGTPSGLQLVRCASLRDISPVGFVDMKEQALPKIARQFDAKVVHRRHATAAPIRHRQDYLAALRIRHGGAPSPSAIPTVFDREPSTCFNLVEDGAEIASTASLHDSVVLRGGKVDGGAIVARSVVCGGAVVGPGQVIVDRIITPTPR
ncbi:MAG: hypothetical protein IT440_12865, partial [Phycisphaeraceae bacterium]|nr:hypothetical protein [Phycisphaeraceae bacterium]